MDADWHTGLSTLRDRGEKLLKSEILCDCEFLLGTEKEKIQGHKLFLAISSPVFEAMMYGSLAEKNPIEIKDIEPEAFKGLLQFLYSDQVDFSSCSHACEVYEAACKYIIPSLQKYCVKYLQQNVNADTACELYEIAQFHEDPDINELKEDCLKVFRNDTKAILESDSFMECNYSTVLAIFEQTVLNIDSELDLFEGLRKWTEAESSRSGQPLEDLAELVCEAVCNIKFLDMTADEFTGGPALSPLLTAQEKLAIAMNITKPGVIAIPERIIKITRARRVTEPNVEECHPDNWSLERVVTNTIVYPVSKWLNPFSKKGLTVSKNIKLKGLKISSQRSPLTDDSTLTYKENVTVVIKKDWSIKLHGAKFLGETRYNSTFTVLFDHPVLLEAGKKYWLIVQFDKSGDYQFTRDSNCLYEMYNNKIQLFEEFSAITELLFLDNV